MAIPYGSIPRPRFVFPIVGTLVVGVIYSITLHMYGVFSVPIVNKIAVSQFENTDESFVLTQAANVDAALVLGLFWIIALAFMWYPYISLYIRYRRSQNA